MELKPGAKLGPYEILSAIGAGGMGQVWKARDTRLDRIVAIKTSAAKFSERFDREARAVAALNHPHICTLYDVGPDYLVMEYVEGSEIKGPLPLDQALKYAIQLASALEAAHRKGISHRDLKPANIMVTKAGTKVLDFGLAKIETAPLDPASDETLTRALTQEGSIVGTLQYMAPEQLHGKVTDTRADIFSFGCVLYELLTGKRAFEGASTASVIAAILEREPPPVPAAVPPALDWVLRLCLAKDPDDRWQSVRDLRSALERVAQSGTAESPGVPLPVKTRFSWLTQGIPWGLAAALAIAAGLLAFTHFREIPPPAPDALRFRVNLPENVTFSVTGQLVLSPDAKHIAFSAVGPDGAGVWVQDMDSSVARSLPDTATGSNPPPFFWSPDSRYVVFSGLSKLRKADIEHGGTEDICSKPGPPIGGDWNQDGVIIFGSTTTGLWRVPAAGGTAVPLTTLDSSRLEIQHELPAFLPDGKHFVFLANSRDNNQTGIYVGSLAEPASQKTKKILAAQFGAEFVFGFDRGRASATEQSLKLLYLRDHLLMAQDFDAEKLELHGEPSVLPVRVGSVFQTGYFSARKSLLVYRDPAGSQLSQFKWFDDENGKLLDNVGTPGLISQPRISPDGSRVAYVNAGSGDRNELDIWILDLQRGSSSRVTFGQGIFEHPVWSPDGTEMAFASLKDKHYQIYRKRVGGSEEPQLMVQSPQNAIPMDWSPDGRFLVYGVNVPAPGAPSHQDIWVVSTEKGGQPLPFARSQFDKGFGRFSPDGHWILYASNETGRFEIYVRAFNATSPSADSESWMISKDGGTTPQWRSDGKEIAWIQQRPDVISVLAAIDTSHGFHAGLPHVLNADPLGATAGTYSSDLKRELLVMPDSSEDLRKKAQFFDVMVNWPSALKKQ